MKYLKAFENGDDKRKWGRNTPLPFHYHSLTPDQKQKHREAGEAIRKMMSTPPTMAFIHPKEVRESVDRLKYILEDEGFKVRHTTQPRVQNAEAYLIFHRSGTKESVTGLEDNLDFIEFKNRLSEDLGYCRVEIYPNEYLDMNDNPDLDIFVRNVFVRNSAWYYRLLVVNLPHKPSNYIKEAVEVPSEVKSQMCGVNVKHIGFDGMTKSGRIICNKTIAEDIHEIFIHLLGIKFPIYSIHPISEFDWDDKKSVAANNTSCFNWRLVIGSDKVSDHALGLAIDINPMQNPWIHPSAHSIPGRKYDESQKGTITKDSEVVEIFKSHGFKWGGDWKNPDYQHFFKTDLKIKNEIIGKIF